MTRRRKKKGGLQNKKTSFFEILECYRRFCCEKEDGSADRSCCRGGWPLVRVSAVCWFWWVLVVRGERKKEGKKEEGKERG